MDRSVKSVNERNCGVVKEVCWRVMTDSWTSLVVKKDGVLWDEKRKPVRVDGRVPGAETWISLRALIRSFMVFTCATVHTISHALYYTPWRMQSVRNLTAPIVVERSGWSVTCNSGTKNNVSKQCLLYVFPQREDEISQKGNWRWVWAGLYV